MNGTAAQEFLRHAAEKSADLAHRQIITRNMDHYDAAVARGKSRFVSWEMAREQAAAIKREAVENLDELLLEFERRVIERGGKVFWAANSEEARDYIRSLARARNVKRVVKVKSMVTEEIHLTPALESDGLKVFETDLGEFIVQLRNEPPYHIVTPAMHLTRVEIAQLFKEKLGGIDTQDPQQLVAAARRELRAAFFSAEMGISGANFLVADQGMIALTTNEGNGRLCTTLPRIHVAIAGIEKIIPRMSDLAVLWPTLATAGTGQPLTTYNTLIGGPKREGEVDGPEEFHVILLDNGRSELLADREQREVLQCIRCGACLNACPVFKQVGGHTYGTTYQGPIGSVLTPHLRGAEFDHLSYASSLCGACTSVCPVKIDLHHHLLQNRRNSTTRDNGRWTERIAFRLWQWTMLSSTRFSLAGKLARLALQLMNGAGPISKWTQYRAPLSVPEKSFRELWEEQNGR